MRLDRESDTTADGLDRNAPSSRRIRSGLPSFGGRRVSRRQRVPVRPLSAPPAALTSRTRVPLRSQSVHDARYRSQRAVSAVSASAGAAAFGSSRRLEVVADRRRRWRSAGSARSARAASLREAPRPARTPRGPDRVPATISVEWTSRYAANNTTPRIVMTTSEIVSGSRTPQRLPSAPSGAVGHEQASGVGRRVTQFGGRWKLSVDTAGDSSEKPKSTVERTEGWPVDRVPKYDSSSRRPEQSGVTN